MTKSRSEGNFIKILALNDPKRESIVNGCKAAVVLMRTNRRRAGAAEEIAENFYCLYEKIRKFASREEFLINFAVVFATGNDQTVSFSEF